MKPTCIFMLIATLFTACGGPGDKKHANGSGSNPETPNILYIMSDDHTSQAISAYGGMLGEVCPTPNIDRLAREGMLFSNCFVTNSICSPSRAAIMTGKYAHKNGVYKFTALDHRQPTLPKIMQKAGYQTAFIGKYHLHSNPVGLDYYEILPGQGRYHDPEFIKIGDEHPSGWVQQGKRTTYQGHSSDVIADRTLDYLKNRRDRDKPFMLFCHFKAPHDTWEFAERYSDFLEDVEIPEPPNLFDDYKGREALKRTLQYIGSEWGDHTNFEDQTGHLQGAEKRKMQYQLYMKKYLRCVKGVDDNVGRILDYLEESGLARNTIVIYTGDQGFFLGEHGLYDKRFMYEEALRMPFLIRWPGHIDQGSVSDGMILNIDFAPTIMDAAGLEPDPEMQGRSFMDLTRGRLPSDWRESMYYRYYYSHFETEPHYGIRTYTHKLIYFDRIDQWELYDLEKDPMEMDNVYDHPDYQEVAKVLKEKLYQLQSELGDNRQDVGDLPNIGELAANPLHVIREVDLSTGNLSVLTRFRTGIGGILFSTGDLDHSLKEWWEEGVNYVAMFIRESNLIFFDGDEEYVIGEAVSDNQWHTVALLLKSGQPTIYLDGLVTGSIGTRISKEGFPQNFNIGAGMDDNGYMGYNFRGDISQTLIYNEIVTGENIELFASGILPEGEMILSWTQKSGQ
jgi:arylsulfatase A-like enzyme